ncbi:MAG: hypothetical protein LW636_03220 [Planctomycetaceae bacterium]|jgi:hypothetical protein|nr:hypothetical protein [Planctomycetaceae bacterium]
MVYLTVVLLLILSGLIVAIMIRDSLRGEVEIFSARNTFLFGILLFQSVSASISLLAEDYGQVYLQSVGLTSLIFTGLLTLFLIIFFFTYAKGPWVVRWANRTPTEHDATEGGLLLCAFAAVGAGLIFRFVIGPIPIIGVLTQQFAAGSFAVACGLAGWAWGRRPANFAIVATAIILLVFCIASLLAYTFGRREVLGVLITFVWALFYARWRFSGASLLVARTVVFGSIGFAFLVFFTASRRGDETQRTATEYLVAFTQVTGPEIVESAFALTNGQQAGSNSMWLIETHPKDFPYDTLHSLGYYLTQPVPRAIWESKYEPLGRTMVADARITRVAEEYSVGPGIVGHVVNDNPWITLPLYAVLLGLALRYLDERVRRCVDDPFVVVPLGAGLAQILGMPRGELGLFAFQLTTAIIGGWAVLRMVGPLVWWRVDRTEDDLEDDGSDADTDADADDASFANANGRRP